MPVQQYREEFQETPSKGKCSNREYNVVTFSQFLVFSIRSYEIQRDKSQLNSKSVVHTAVGYSKLYMTQVI